SQRLAVLSALPEASVLPSGEKATPPIQPVCPLSVTGSWASACPTNIAKNSALKQIARIADLGKSTLEGLYCASGLPQNQEAKCPPDSPVCTGKGTISR